ncbi:hypothetical protein CFP56_019081, partial [Quercus suber]
RIKLPKLIKQEHQLENLKDVNLKGCEFITKLPKLSAPNLEKLNLSNCENLVGLPKLRAPNINIYKLQQLWKFWTPTGKLRPTCDSFDSSSGYGFEKMKKLKFMGFEGIIELDLLKKPNYFPALERIELYKNNIVTIPDISRFPRLKSLDIRDCKLLREIQGLPQSIRSVEAGNCMLLDTQSPSGLLSQVVEIIGILPNRVCGRARSNKLMDPQLTNYFPSETEGAESEDGDIDRAIYCWGTEMPKWFNHQSVDNSIFFFVGHKFPKLAVCVVPRREFVSGFVHISINGYKKSDLYVRGNSQKKKSIYRRGGLMKDHNVDFDRFKFFSRENNLFLFSLTQRSLQRHLNESNPTDQNRVEVSITYGNNEYSVKRWGVHVECTCPPQGDDAVDYLPTSKKLGTF